MRNRITLSCALAALVLLCACAQSRAVLINHWDFEDGSGTTATDIISGNNGALQGGMGNANWVVGAPLAGGSNFALFFDGNNDGIDTAPYTGATVSGTNPRSIAAWVKTNTINDAIISWGENNNGQKWVIRTNDNGGNGQIGGLRLEVNGGFQIGSTVLNDGRWHHVAVTWENDGTPNVLDSLLYVDGVLETISGSQTNVINTNAVHTVQLGTDSHTAGRNWDGFLDDMRIYNHVLTAGEVATLAAQSGALPLPAIEWNASNDPTPGDATWEETAGMNANLDFALDAPPAATYNPSPMTNAAALTASYTFNGSGGGQMSNIDADSLGDISDESVAIEVIFKPANLVGQKVIVDFGGQTIGTSFTMNGDVLQFISEDNANDGAVIAVLSEPFNDFVHAVGVIDFASNLVSLYVDGMLVGTDVFTGSDWAGTNGDGIGVRGNTETGGDGGTFGALNGYGAFEGDIALVAIYREPLNADEVGAVYNARFSAAPVPEPAALGLLALAAGALVRRRRRDA